MILIDIIIIDNWCCGVLMWLTFIQLYNITLSFNSYLYLQVAMVYTFQLFCEADDTLLLPFTLICFER